MQIRDALRLISDLFLLSAEETDNLDIKPIPENTEVKEGIFIKIAWRYRAENPKGSIRDFLLSNRYFLEIADCCD